MPSELVLVKERHTRSEIDLDHIGSEALLRSMNYSTIHFKIGVWWPASLTIQGGPKCNLFISLVSRASRQRRDRVAKAINLSFRHPFQVDSTSLYSFTLQVWSQDLPSLLRVIAMAPKVAFLMADYGHDPTGKGHDKTSDRIAKTHAYVKRPLCPTQNSRKPALRLILLLKKETCQNAMPRCLQAWRRSY